MSTDSEQLNRQMWHAMLHGKFEHLQRYRTWFKILPSNPRCTICNAPFEGFGGRVVRTFWNRKPSGLNPRYCNACEHFGEMYPGGAEVLITMIFADVRGSTTIAENMNPSEFRTLLNRFYKASTNVLVDTNAWIDKLVGDEIIALFIPGFVGEDHAKVAIAAAQELLHAVGYGSKDGPWIPIGVGVHTDTVYVGVVGSEGVTDITALGDGMNTTARLVSNAAAGEILVSEATVKASGLDMSHYEARELTVKGRTEPVNVRVLGVEHREVVP
jgi:adenylate cyclase